MVDLLAIPDFLDRRNDPPIKTRRVTRNVKTALPKLPKPKGKFKNAEAISLYFADEVPRIPTGEREVYVVEGRKWVYLQEKSHNQNTARTTKAKFNMVVSNTEKRRANSEA